MVYLQLISFPPIIFDLILLFDFYNPLKPLKILRKFVLVTEITVFPSNNSKMRSILSVSPFWVRQAEHPAIRLPCCCVFRAVARTHYSDKEDKFMNENRRRNKTITVRVTEKEKEYILSDIKVITDFVDEMKLDNDIYKQ